MRLVVSAKVWARNISLSREYFIFAVIVVIAATGAALSVGLITYKAYLDKTNHTIQTDAIRINKLLEDTLNETSQIMVYIGKQIARNGGTDLQFIAHLLKNISGREYKNDNFFSWSGFDWVSPDNLQLVNSKNGIAITPPNMSHREYTWKSPDHPWTLQVSKPAIGNPSKTRVIPVGVGVTDAKENYLGTLVIGLNISEITSKIENLIGRTPTKFIILDNNHNIIFQSTDTVLNNDDTHYNTIPDEVLSNDRGELSHHISYNGILYTHYSKMDGFPYLILTGTNSVMQNKELYSLLFPRIIEFVLAGFLGLMLLFFFRRKIITPINDLVNVATAISKGNYTVKIPRQTSQEMLSLAISLTRIKRSIKKNLHYQTQLAEAYYQLQLAEILKKKNQELEEIKERLEQAAELVKASDDAKKEFSRRIQHELNTPLDTIIYTCETLIKSQRGQIKVEISKDKQLEFIENMYESAKEVKTLTTHILNIGPINVKEAIEKCVTLHLKEALAKHVHLKTNIANNIPLFYADDLRFRQIIVGLISRSIEYTPRGGNIEIEAESTMRNDNKRYLRLTVKDNGFGLSEEDIERLNYKFGKGALNQKSDGIALELPAIQKLVHLHKGSCKIDNQLTKGTIVIITFPYLEEDELEEIQRSKSENITNNSNVVRLF